MTIDLDFPDSMKIRRATRKDRPGWKVLRHGLWPNSTEREQGEEMDSYLQEGGRLAAFVAERSDGSIAGFVEVSMRPVESDQPIGAIRQVGYVEGLYVDDVDRRKGIGIALVRAAERWAKRQGAREMGSDTQTNNRVSQAFHRAVGFQERERLVIFGKRLR